MQQFGDHKTSRWVEWLQNIRAWEAFGMSGGEKNRHGVNEKIDLD